MQTIQEVYAGRTLQQIEESLRISGTLAENARLHSKTLTQKSRSFIAEARAAAARYGLSRSLQNALEDEGARAAREAVRS